MRKKILLIVLPFLLVGSAYAQVTVSGVVKDKLTQQPLVDVTVTLSHQNISTTTSADGSFKFAGITDGTDDLIITRGGEVIGQYPADITSKNNGNLGDIYVNQNMQTAAKEDLLLTLSESDLEGVSDNEQNVSGLLTSGSDVYSSIAAYNWGSLRFRVRGYQSQYNTTYINGIKLNDAERGYFSYGQVGGLNDMVRSKDAVNGMDYSTYSFGNLGGTVDINARASKIRKGLKISQVSSNQSYRSRTMITYSSGLTQSGWAFAGSLSYRGAKQGYVQGTLYDSWGLGLAVEKRFNEAHSLSFTFLDAEQHRGQQSGSTQEVYDLTPKRNLLGQTVEGEYGNNYYNANWGYQNGQIRNARQVYVSSPILILSHIWNFDDKMSQLTTSVGYKYQNDRRSALNWYKSADPRPDYYRNLPEYYISTGDNEAADLREELWKTDENYRQINWDELYQVNYLANATGKSGRYMVELRHNNQYVFTFNSVLNKHITDEWHLDAGVEYQFTKGMHYKTVNDLLGADYWLDIDQYGERDNPGDPDFMQNDLNNPNRHVKKGDIFGYNYDIYATNADVWGQLKLSKPRYDLYFALQGMYSNFWRNGNMLNGRASDSIYMARTINGVAREWKYVNGSYGASPMQNFFTGSAKFGGNYRLTGRYVIQWNLSAGTNPVYANNAYFSPRVKANLIPDLTPETYLSGDFTYYIRNPKVTGRFTLYASQFWNSTDISSFYNDEYQTFVNVAMYGFSKRHLGAEVGLDIKLTPTVTLENATNIGRYIYFSNADATVSYENGLESDQKREILINGFHMDGTPEFASSFGLKYAGQKYWFLELFGNYFGKRYLDFNPLRRTASATDGLTPADNAEEIAAITDQTVAKGGWTVDASIGKSIRIKYKYYININLSMKNILNNTNLVTGGYEQGRFSSNNTSVTRLQYIERYPAKYYYAYGATYYLNIGFRF